MPAPVLAAVAIGSNLGDRHAHVIHALVRLAGLPGTRLWARSSVIQTEPVGPVPQGPYLNAAAILRTALAPRALLNALLEIEASRGRDRAAGERWGPRTLDLDLLLYGGLSLNEPDLVIPHPRLHERRFVLEPLAQIAPSLIVPALDRSVGELLASLP